MTRSILVSMVLMMVTAVPSRAQQADSLSLDDAIALVLKNNPAVSEAERHVDASRAAVDVSRSGFYPEATANLSYARVGPVAELAFPGLGLFELFPANNYDGHLSVSQKVYDFSKTSEAVNLASSQIGLSRDKLDQVKRDLAYATVQSFYTILFLHQAIRVQDDQIHALNEYLSVAQKKLDAGTATEFDVLTTRVRIAAAQTRKTDLLNKLRKEQIALRRLAVVPEERPLNLTGTFQAGPVAMDPDSLFAVAEAGNIDLKTSADAVASAEIRMRVAAASNNPSLSVDLAYGIKNGYIPNLDALRGNFAAGVSVRVPIFDGMRTSRLEQEAQANLLAARDHGTVVRTQVRADILDALSDLRTSTEKLQSSRLNVEQAQQAVGLAKAKYDAGVITNLDLLDAQTALEQARLDDLGALYGFVLSKYGLQRAVGEHIW